MIQTDTNNLFQLQDNDFINYNNDVYYISLPPYIQFSIIQNNNVIIPIDIQCSNQEKIVYLYKTNQLNPYFLAIHVPKQGMKGIKNYSAFQSIQLILQLLNTKNTLLNKKIIPTKQNNQQLVDVPLPLDDSYVFIKVADKLAYSNNLNDVVVSPAYLPKYNTTLQKITIKIKADTIDKWDNLILSPPIALDMMLFNPDNNNHYVRIKSPVIVGNWSDNIDDKPAFLENYGYEYATFNKKDNNGFIWRSNYNNYSFNMDYIFEWQLSQDNINTLINIHDNKQEIYFQCRYSIETYNSNYVWRHFSNPIKIKINTPPTPPVNLQMLERQ